MGPDAIFRAHLAEGRFMIQRAADGTAVFPPRAVAPGSGAVLDWVAASGRGTVYSTTIVRKRPPEPSYNVALIALEEGPRMMSRVDGVDPTAVAIGMAVTATIVTENDVAVLVFEPVT